jgi:hypothetical protein
MATRTAELNIKLTGEQQYKQTIAEINRGNQVLNAEMKKLAEQYKGNEDSMEALTAKSDLLQRQLQQQRDKVQTLREAVQNAATQYGEADRRTQSWQTQLLNAERDEIKLQRALEDTNRDLEAQGEASEETAGKMTTLGDQVSSIADKFGIRLPDSVKSALDNVGGFSTGTVAAMGAAAAGVAAVELAIKAVGAGIQAVQKLNEITLEQAKWADDLLTRSAQTGLDTGTLQGLDYASKFLDFEGIDQSLVKLTASMDKARDGADKQAQAFEALGVSVTGADGQLRDNWETFKDVIDALGKVQNATERDALANDLFGKSYSELKPLIDAGSDSLQELMDKAEESGYVLDESQVRKLGEVDDAYQEYQAQIEATKNKLAVEFAPVSTEVMGKFGTFISDVGQKFVDSGIIDSIGKLVEPLGVMLGTVSDLVDWALPPLVGLIDDVAGAFSWAAEKVADFVGWLTQIDEDSIERAMTDPEINSFDWGTGGLGYNAAGDTNWRGGLTWVGEQGPELVSLPKGSRIYSNPESERIAAGTDTRAIESLLTGIASKLQRIDDNLSDMETVRRMYGYG